MAVSTSPLKPSPGNLDRSGSTGAVSQGLWARPKNSIPALDGLRAIAIILVVARHGIRPFWNDDGFLTVLGWDIGTPFHNGWMGVDLFFVLSGFLITLHILRRYGQGFGVNDLGDYASRRAFRIVPAYAASVALAVSGIIPLFEVDRENLLWRLGYHAVFLQDYLPSDIVVVYWSLGVEEKFYLVAPFALMAVLRLNRPRARYGAIVALALMPTMLRLWKYTAGSPVEDYGTFFEQLRSPFHMTFDGLALGVLAALIYVDRSRFQWAQRSAITSLLAWGGLAAFAILLIGHPMMIQISWFDRTIMQTLIAIASACALLGLVLGGGPIRLLSGHGMFVLGKLSYSWYLTHLMVIPLSWELSSRLFSGVARFGFFTAVYLATSLALALALHLLVERPFLAVRDRRR